MKKTTYSTQNKELISQDEVKQIISELSKELDEYLSGISITSPIKPKFKLTSNVEMNENKDKKLTVDFSVNLEVYGNETKD